MNAHAPTPASTSAPTHAPGSDTGQAQRDYRRIEAAIAHIAAHRDDAPSLDEIAAAVHLSPFHFQRMFTRWAGVSPKRFACYLSLEQARAGPARRRRELPRRRLRCRAVRPRTAS